MSRGTRLAAATGAALLALGPAYGAGPASTGERYVTGNGREVVIESVDGMTCQQLLDKIVEIDATGYRGRRPAPLKPRDHRLLVYEKAVSTRYYTLCSGRGDATVSEILRRGLATAAD